MLKICLVIALLVNPFNFQSVNELIKKADDAAYLQFDNKLALQILEEANKLEKNNYEVLLRLGRTYIDIGEHSEEQKQLELFEKSLFYSEQAIKINPNGSFGYTRRAAALGKISLFKGVWESLDLVGKIKSDLEKAIKLDKTNSVAFYILGRTHAKLCEKPKFIRIPLGIGWANMEESISNYVKALAFRPKFIMFNLDLARAYVEIEEYQKARNILNKIPYYPKEDEDDEVFRKEAADLLNKIKSY